MGRLFGARTGIEAVFLIAVPIGALAAGLSAFGIIVASAVAYLLVLLVETGLARGFALPRPAPRPRREPPKPPREPAPERETTVVVHPEPAVEQVAASEPMPIPEPEPEPEPEPVLHALPGPEPQPEPEPEPEPEPVLAPPTPLPVSTAPRQWNIWELERLARDGGGDPARNEERHFLLMYLREYADADGLLPVEFDGLVRESFGDVLGTA